MLSYLLWLFVKGILLVLLSIILLYAGREYIAYQNLQFFKKQGVKCYYIPLFGLMSMWSKKRTTNDGMENFYKLFEENKDGPLIMFNTSKTTKSIGYLLDDELIREFAIKETEYTGKIEFMKDTHLGFFFQNGEKFQHARAAYAKFFNFENLRSLTLTISKSIDHAFQQISAQESNKAQTSNTYGEGWSKVHLIPTLETVFIEVVNKVIFGEEERHSIDGLDLLLVIQEHIKNIFALNTDPLNNLSLHYLHIFGLHPKTRQCRREYEKIRNKCWDIYQTRKKSGPKSTPNLLDLLVSRDKDLRDQGKEGLSQDEVVGDFLALQFASIDTSKEISTNSIMLLCQIPDQLEAWKQIQKSIFEKKNSLECLSYEDIEGKEKLDCFIQEFMRLGAPVPTSTIRLVHKPLKLGKFSFRPGDCLMIPFGLSHQWTKYWENPEQFDPERMSKERTKSYKRSAYLPFGVGRRMCVGKELGEIMVKLILLTFFRHFDVQRDPDCDLTKSYKLTYGYQDPTIFIRPAQRSS